MPSQSCRLAPVLHPLSTARLLPGVLLAAALGAAAAHASEWIGTDWLGLPKSPVSPVMIAIVAGMTIGNLLRLPAAVRPGLRFATTRILRLGIILLGIRLSVFEVVRLGAVSVPIVLTCILFGIGFTSLLGRWFSLPARLGTLIGVGTSICGVSAIAATGPAIDARDEEVAYAVAVITVFGLLAMIAYPWVVDGLFAADPTSVGLFLGTSVHDTSQVNGAGMIYRDLHQAPRALDAAIVTKLVRNLFMIAVIPFMAFRHHRAGRTERGEGVPWTRLFPLFVLGFLLMAVLRSVGDAGAEEGKAFGVWDTASWSGLHGTITGWSTACMVVALSAVGLGTDFRAMRRLSVTPFLVGLGAALAVGVVSFAGIRLLGSWGFF